MADFYLDHDVAVAVADELRNLAHLATTTRELGEETAGDFRQLLIASEHNWLLVSHNK